MQPRSSPSFVLLIAGIVVLTLHAQQVSKISAKPAPRSFSLLVPYVPTVTGASFTAEYEIQMQMPLVGGGSETWHSTTQVARDSSGRIRHELYDFAPSSISKEPPLQCVILTDPVSRLRHILDPAWRTDERQWFHTSHLTRLGADGIEGEGLGIRTMNSLAVTGERRTWTRRTRLDASGQPISVTDETWYSDKLQLVVFEQQRDSAGQVLTIVMSRFDRSEPPASLFTVPRGYHLPNTSTHSAPGPFYPMLADGSFPGWGGAIPGPDWSPDVSGRW